jgi:2',3'-cyclic-nucleotide 2'-phosphodiesterase
VRRCSISHGPYAINHQRFRLRSPVERASSGVARGRGAGAQAAAMIRLLFIGDIVGRPGRELVRRGLAGIVDFHRIDLVIANAENSAAGFGITREIGDQLLEWGVDVMTSGNHIWDKKEALDYIGAETRLLRPANYPAGAPGNGRYLARTRDGRSVGIVNVMGRVFMLNIDDPFTVVLREIEALKERTRVVFVDFHAEATSEKIAMGWHLDGKVTAVVGTHTHVQTADERILPQGTAYLTDVGMTGPHDSIIGVDIQAALGRFLTALPARFETATGNPRLNAVIVEADEQTGRATDIERLSLSADDIQQLADLADERPVRSSV